jgi:hypothetical protein
MARVYGSTNTGDQAWRALCFVGVMVVQTRLMMHAPSVLHSLQQRPSDRPALTETLESRGEVMPLLSHRRSTVECTEKCTVWRVWRVSES